MIKKAFRLFIIVILYVFITQNLIAQDIHYSQFYNEPIIINPANTGVFNGDVRVKGSYKNQWSSVPVPWRTFTLSGDAKLLNRNMDDHFFSIGLAFNNDKQGTSRLSLNNLNLTASFTKIINPHNIVTIGAGIGYARRAFDISSLTWDSQWDGDAFDGTINNGETFDNSKLSFVENSLGLNYRLQKDTRTKLDLGIGIYHLIEPSVPFYDNDAKKLPKRVSLTGLASVQIAKKLDLQAHFLQQLQSDYREAIIGGLLKYYVNQNRGKDFQIHAGLGYRTSKTLVPTIAIQINQFYGSLSYDIDKTKFSEHTRNKGGIEMHFTYIVSKVKPLGRAKLCPIY